MKKQTLNSVGAAVIAGLVGAAALQFTDYQRDAKAWDNKLAAVEKGIDEDKSAGRLDAAVRESIFHLCLLEYRDAGERAHIAHTQCKVRYASGT